MTYQLSGLFEGFGAARTRQVTVVLVETLLMGYTQSQLSENIRTAKLGISLLQEPNTAVRDDLVIHASALLASDVITSHEIVIPSSGLTPPPGAPARLIPLPHDDHNDNSDDTCMTPQGRPGLEPRSAKRGMSETRISGELTKNCLHKLDKQGLCSQEFHLKIQPHILNRRHENAQILSTCNT